MAFSPADSALLASASDDESCRVWRLKGSGVTQAASFHGHQDSVMRVSWAPTGSVLASGQHAVELRENLDIAWLARKHKLALIAHHAC